MLLVPKEETQVQDVSYYADPIADQLIKHSLRTQLESMLQTKLTAAQRQKALQDSFVAAMTLVLSETKSQHKLLTDTFQTMYAHACQSLVEAKLSQDELTRQYISASGLIMSPLNCKHTIKDIYRISGYVRGLDKAIQQMLNRKDQLSILYPACGPFAPLLLPLLSYYRDNQLVNSEQLQITLLDVHPGAVKALEQLVNDLQLNDYIKAIELGDATTYQSLETFDLLILEAMQHGFSKEGFLSIAKHLVQYLDIQGEMIPKEVSVRAMMVIGETEFNQQWRGVEYSHSDHLSKEALANRVELGEILKINKTSLLKAQVFELDGGMKMLEANTIQLPQGVTDMAKRILAIYTQVDTFGNELVNQYDSGITAPKPDMTFYVDAKPKMIEHHYFEAKSGDLVKFYYQLTGLPGFVATNGQSV